MSDNRAVVDAIHSLRDTIHYDLAWIALAIIALIALIIFKEVRK